MMTLSTNDAVNKLSSIIADPKTYTQVFDSSNRNWERQPEYVMLFLKNVQNYVNDLLSARGYVFLNDVYDRLGFERTPDGQVVGWISDGSIGRISFGLSNESTDPLTPPESITLEFNTDGIIFNLI